MLRIRRNCLTTNVAGTSDVCEWHRSTSDIIDEKVDTDENRKTGHVLTRSSGTSASTVSSLERQGQI